MVTVPDAVTIMQISNWPPKVDLLVEHVDHNNYKELESKDQQSTERLARYLVNNYVLRPNE